MRRPSILSRALRVISPRGGIESTDRQLAQIRKSGLFDADWYLARYPDVAASGVDPAEHYVRFGAGEDRDPGPHFSTSAYRENHPELLRGAVNPLAHHLRRSRRWLHGRGRTAAPAVRSKDSPEPLALGPEGAPRIVILSGEADTPGHVYRVERLARALAETGFRVVAIAALDLEDWLEQVPGSAALVIWRTPWSSELAEAIRRARETGGKVVFDVDDYMFEPSLASPDIIDGIRSQGFDAAAVARHYARIGETMRAADFCLCSTDQLAGPLRQLTRPTFVIPNGFDEEVYRVSRLAALAKRHTRPDGLVRLGYAAGSRTHQRDFAQASGAIARVLREHDFVRLVLFRRGATETLDPREFPDFVGLDDRIEWREFVPLRRLPEEVARFDVNLVPLEVGNPFVEAKSELKYFEAALAGVATVASPTGPYRAAIRHGETGFLAEKEEDWHRVLKQLVADGDVRHRVARNALHDVLWRFGSEQRVETVSSVFGQILEHGRPAARLFQLEVLRATMPRRRPPEVPGFDVAFESPRHEIGEVAVAVPLYNYERYIQEALDSVRMQTLTKIDLVVVDDCSTDRSLIVARDWLERHQERFNHVALLRNHRNAGLGLTRNVAFAFAEAAFVMTLDADNKLLPDCLRQCVEHLRRTGAAAAYPTIQTFGDSERMMGTEEWSGARLTCGPYIDAMALFRKSAWAAAGGYGDRLLGWEDYELWCRFAELGLWAVRVAEVLALYRTHAASMTRTQTAQTASLRKLVDDFEARHPWLDLPTIAETR